MKTLQKGEGFPGQRIVVLPRSVVADASTQALMSGLVPTDVGFFPQAAGHLRERPSGAGQVIFIYCIKGEGWCAVHGCRHRVRAGELLILPPSVAHAYGAEAAHPWSIYWFHAEGSLIGAYLRELDATREQPVISLGEAPQVRALFEEVLEVVEHGYTRLQMLCACQTLAHLVAVMIRESHLAHHAQPSVQQKIAQTVDHMKQHLHQPLSLSALAAIANLSRSRYVELFKKQIGYAPIDYLIRLRMHAAAQLLDTTDMSVKAIAAATGYADALYFSRLFRRVNEQSPMEYRKLRKG